MKRLARVLVVAIALVVTVLAGAAHGGELTSTGSTEATGVTTWSDLLRYALDHCKRSANHVRPAALG